MLHSLKRTCQSSSHLNVLFQKENNIKENYCFFKSKHCFISFKKKNQKENPSRVALYNLLTQKSVAMNFSSLLFFSAKKYVKKCATKKKCKPNQIVSCQSQVPPQPLPCVTMNHSILRVTQLTI